MKRTSKRLLQSVIAAFAFIMLLGYAGSYERSEQIIYQMPQEAYDAIVTKLGDTASIKDIAREYTDNQSYYDNRY